MRRKLLPYSDCQDGKVNWTTESGVAITVSSILSHKAELAGKIVRCARQENHHSVKFIAHPNPSPLQFRVSWRMFDACNTRLYEAQQVRAMRGPAYLRMFGQFRREQHL